MEESIMDLKTIKFLAEYNSITNKNMNEYIKGLTEEQWTKKFGGYFNSIRSLCNHLCISDFNWLKRFSLLRPFEYIKDQFFKNTYSFGSHAITTKDDYFRLRKELDNYLKLFEEELKEEDLNKRLIYRDSHNDEHNQEFGLVVLHVFNHQTHHRGMISIYLEEMGIENDYSNIMDII
jgi:uncharacterized damage-inducible protein DinB